MAGTFTNDEYTDMVLLYGEALENASKARRLYAERFPERRLPSTSVFKRTVMRLKIDGSFEVHQVRPRPVCDNEATVQQVSEYFQENPTHSQRRAASELGVKRNSINTILKERSWDPHQTKSTLKRPPIDLQKLVDYCRRIVESEKNKSQLAKAESNGCVGLVGSKRENVNLESADCGRRIVDSELKNPRFVNTQSDGSTKAVDSGLEKPQFIKVEPLE